LKRIDWTSELSEYKEPKNWVFIVPDEPGEFWGRRLVAIAFKNSKGKSLEHKRLGGTDSALRDRLESLGMEALPWNGVAAKQDRKSANVELLEGRRQNAERTYFVRNATVARKVKQDADYTCQSCGFKGSDRFDQFGERCIEAHHLRAFGERTDEEQSKNRPAVEEEIVALCANCHRVVHGRSPALSMVELEALHLKPSPL